MRGKLITFEGIDGSGKTTIVNMLKEKIDNAIITYEPTKTWLGNNVKKAIEERKNVITIALLFMADRSQHVKEIKKWIEDGKIVLCDRYIDSTYAYQKEELKNIIKNPEEWIEFIHKPFLIKPDLTLLFVLPVEIAIKRIGNRKKILYEKKEFLEKVQQNYIEIAKREKRFVIIDASKNIEEVEQKCIDAITKFLVLRQAQG